MNRSDLYIHEKLAGPALPAVGRVARESRKNRLAMGRSLAEAVEQFVLPNNQFQPTEPVTTACRGLFGAAPGSKDTPAVAGGGAAATRVLLSSESMRYATGTTGRPSHRVAPTMQARGCGWRAGETRNVSPCLTQPAEHRIFIRPFLG